MCFHPFRFLKRCFQWFGNVTAWLEAIAKAQIRQEIIMSTLSDSFDSFAASFNAFAIDFAAVVAKLQAAQGDAAATADLVAKLPAMSDSVKSMDAVAQGILNPVVASTAPAV